VRHLKKWLAVIHPLLFALFFVLALYSANVAEVSPSEIAIPIVAAIALALLVLILTLLMIGLIRGLIRKIHKSPQSSQQYRIWDIKKAAIVASIFIILFFTFGFFLRALDGWDDIHRTIRAPLFWLMPSILWIALLATGGYFIIKTNRDLRKLTIILSIVSFSMVIIPTVHIIVNETKTAAQDTYTSESIADLIKPDALPDIYYIILDRYASASTLEEAYDFDNSDFLEYLSNEGFYVANQSASNYPYTYTSLLSSLNMDFLQEYDFETSWSIMSHADYKVWRYLKTIDYKFIHVGSWWEVTRENPYADMNINYYAMPEFSWFLFQSTWAYPISLTLNIVDEFSEMQYRRTLYEYNKMAEIPGIAEPTFLFAHMLTPHTPYVFDREGNYQTPDEANRKSETANYVDQLIATNSMLMVLIDELLSSSEVPPIIILQADEGPLPGGYEEWLNTDFSKATEAQIRQKMRIFNAYYLPNVDSDILYPSITPVNSFRTIFNLYFGTDFSMLPDNSYASYQDTPFEFFDVTDKVKYD